MSLEILRYRTLTVVLVLTQLCIADNTAPSGCFFWSYHQTSWTMDIESRTKFYKENGFSAKEAAAQAARDREIEREREIGEKDIDLQIRRMEHEERMKAGGACN